MRPAPGKPAPRVRSKPHVIVRNGVDVIAMFPSACLAEEAMYDLGCYVDRCPTPDDQFEVRPLSKFK